ncbi:hypothetical protein C1645_741173 [Glomus cerebriforme]|uniref:Uncharacterized protein n=1 Tax=Glomus cerebriforme TaxID=658196 RepID=A0A397SM63_9GLOM|nr:hypothetical protein C1645_741173 [Glomus cerebriforme]
MEREKEVLEYITTILQAQAEQHQQRKRRSTSPPKDTNQKEKNNPFRPNDTKQGYSSQFTNSNQNAPHQFTVGSLQSINSNPENYKSSIADTTTTSQLNRIYKDDTPTELMETVLTDTDHDEQNSDINAFYTDSDPIQPYTPSQQSKPWLNLSSWIGSNNNF